MRASRLLSIMMLLQTRGRTSATALAKELEVSVRTIYRDVDHLSESGVPVLVQRGAAGGFQLLDGWRTRLTGFTPNEAQALLVSGMPGPAAELGLGQAMASAQLKLLAALPEGWQAPAQQVSARLHLDTRSWYRRPASPSPFLAVVADAVWNQWRVKMRYESWKKEVTREVEPLGLVLKAGDWYMIARSEGDPRTYRLGSIRELVMGEGTFEWPADFDLAAYWVASVERFEKGLYRSTATLRASARGRRGLRSLGAAVAEAVEQADPTADAEGWSRLTIPIESVGHAVPQLLPLQTDVEVLAPQELRVRLARAARNIAALYGGSRVRKRRQIGGFNSL